MEVGAPAWFSILAALGGLVCLMLLIAGVILLIFYLTRGKKEPGDERP